jgi:hypothetical protein
MASTCHDSLANTSTLGLSAVAVFHGESLDVGMQEPQVSSLHRLWQQICYISALRV